ncbi:MAG: hypothetical protein ACREEA_06885 [Stellaceae bacterium]
MGSGFDPYENQDIDPHRDPRFTELRLLVAFVLRKAEGQTLSRAAATPIADRYLEMTLPEELRELQFELDELLTTIPAPVLERALVALGLERRDEPYEPDALAWLGTLRDRLARRLEPRPPRDR